MHRPFSHAKRDTHQRGAQNSPLKSRPVPYAPAGLSPGTGRTAPPARRGLKVAEHQGVGFRIGQHQPCIAENRARGDKQADGGRRSQLDRASGTERVTTSRRPKRVSRKKRIPDQQAIPRPVCQPIPSLPASVTPHQHRAANARADDKRAGWHKTPSAASRAD